MAGMFMDPQATYYGGSEEALKQQRADAIAQMQAGRQLGDQALSGQGGYNIGAGYGQSFTQRGDAILNGYNGGQTPLAQAGSYTTNAALATQAAQSYDPRAAILGASQVAADQNMRNAMSVARGGPNSALAMRQALQMQAVGGIQAQQQAQQMAAQAELQRASLGMQAGQMQMQAGSINAQMALAERQRQQQLGLAQAQMGLGASAQATGQAAQMGQFRENLYSGRDMNVNNNQLQADQFYQQQQAQAAQQQAAFVGGIINGVGGLVGSAASMGGGGMGGMMGGGGGGAADPSGFGNMFVG